jgi:DNA transformation protein
MAQPNAFVDYCIDLLGGPQSIRAKRMFSGHGLYFQDLFIAIVMHDELYLKGDEESAPLFEQAGSVQLKVHESTDRPMALRYWSVPAEALESAALIEPWLQLAIAAAVRSRSTKPSKKKMA